MVQITHGYYTLEFATNGLAKLSGKRKFSASSTAYETRYTVSSDPRLGGTYESIPSSTSSSSVYYKWVIKTLTVSDRYRILSSVCYKYTGATSTTWSRGTTSYGLIAGREDEYPINEHVGNKWYVRGALLPLYTLYKYDSNLSLKSTYDVETGELKTVAVDISNKGDNKVKMILSTTGTAYKTYISNDNATWQEVTDITSGAAKELDVDVWNELYIKIETNGSTINNIDIAYYKE